MPCHPKLRSLEQICMDSIFENMENHWCRHFLKEMNSTHWLFVEGEALLSPYYAYLSPVNSTGIGPVRAIFFIHDIL